MTVKGVKSVKGRGKEGGQEQHERYHLRYREWRRRQQRPLFAKTLIDGFVHRILSLRRHQPSSPCLLETLSLGLQSMVD